MNIKKIRNGLNLLFIIGAVVGMALFYAYNRETGTYVILASMVIKFIESALRMTVK